jgi:hypothetical protein
LLITDPFVNVNEDALLIVGGSGFTTIINVAMPVPPALLALTVTVVVPNADGIPEMIPVVKFN